VGYTGVSLLFMFLGSSFAHNFITKPDLDLTQDLERARRARAARPPSSLPSS
jgi:hypothetical protein